MHLDFVTSQIKAQLLLKASAGKLAIRDANKIIVFNLINN